MDPCRTRIFKHLFRIPPREFTQICGPSKSCINVILMVVYVGLNSIRNLYKQVYAAEKPAFFKQVTNYNIEVMKKK